MLNNNIVFATHNRNKMKEAQALLQGSSFVLSTLADYPQTAQIIDIPETGSTFAENAQQKVDFVKNLLTYSVVADDSGLEVETLAGKPGIHSKRWIEGTDADRNSYLLSQLENIEKRAARFVTILCFFDTSTQQYHFFEGEVLGTIALSPQGNNGFGYDPLFVPQGYNQTFAELGDDVKNQLSHRARAFHKLNDFLIRL